ncbi:MAG: hypothetical protein ABEJ23_08935 [Haloarculaceae archaeon]
MDPAAARSRLLAAHRAPLATVLDCADAVAADWDASGFDRRTATDRAAVVGPLRTALSDAGVLDRFPGLLADAVTAAGGTLRADPVAAPPYVTVASRGPVLRATAAAGERLVVAVEVFDVDRRPARYVRGPATVEAALSVAVR